MLIATLFTVQGNLVLADTGISSIEQTVTIEDLIKMSDKELAEVPQDTLIYVLNNLSAGGEKEVQKYDEKDLQRIANQYLFNEHEIILKEIAKKAPDPSKSSSLQIGQSISVSWAEDGDGGYSGWGVWDADTNYSGELTESYATVAALGGSSSWARTGHTFVVGGSGNGYYRIDMDCSWLCGSVNWGTNTLTLLVEEWRNGNYSSLPPFAIDQYSALAWNHSGDFDYSTPTNVRLYAGATYRISLKVETQASTLASAAGADCLTDSYGAIWDYLHLEYSS